MRRVLIIVVVGILVFPSVQARAQSDAKPLAFEVASVKPNKSGSPQVNFAPEPGGRFVITNASLMDMVGVAFGTPALPRDRVIGEPNWIRSDRFDIVAKAAGNPSREQMQLMLRSLLVERFKLTVHEETRERLFYSLVLAQHDGRLGPKLKRSTVDCSAPDSPSSRRPDSCELKNMPGKVTATSIPMETLARVLVGWVAGNREIRDQTGLAGNFEVALEWLPEGLDPSSAPDLPSLFTALQEQLGLKLESTTGSVDVLVIDHVEPPTPD
jgi:uncharacterized protein (TIGR03435 family)